jgi:hypothetical protein
MLKIDLSGREVIPEPYMTEGFEPGDIVQSRQGKLYVVISANDNTLYYLTIDYLGNVLRPGQVIHGYAISNWKRVGKVEITIGEPEWY